LVESGQDVTSGDGIALESTIHPTQPSAFPFHPFLPSFLLHTEVPDFPCQPACAVLGKDKFVQIQKQIEASKNSAVQSLS